MADVVLDLFPDDRGKFVADIRVGSGRHWADVSGASATIHVGTWPEPDPTAKRLIFRAAVPSTIGVRALEGQPRLILAFVYRAEREAILAFDRRITERYTTYFASIGEQYSGTFDVEGLPAPCIGEFSVLDAATPDEWHAHQGSADIPPDVGEILDECRTLQDRSFARFSIWLTPRGATSGSQDR